MKEKGLETSRGPPQKIKVKTQNKVQLGSKRKEHIKPIVFCSWMYVHLRACCGF